MTDIEELKEFIQSELSNYASDLEGIKNRKIRNIEWLTVSSIDNLPERKKLYSGKEIIITPKGSIRFMEKLPNGAGGVTMDFWSINMKISFKNEDEQFVIDKIGNFVAFD